MNRQYSHGNLAPGASRFKRKEREPFSPPKPSPPPPPRGATVTTTKGGVETAFSNEILAGYMAHEFLTKGTLLGQRFDPARAEAVPAAGKSKSAAAELMKLVKQPKQNESYSEITSLVTLKKEGRGGVHIPGIVNPTELARWIQM